MNQDTTIKFRINSDLKNTALNKGLNLSRVSRDAIRAAVHEDKTYENK